METEDIKIRKSSFIRFSYDKRVSTKNPNNIFGYGHYVTINGIFCQFWSEQGHETRPDATFLECRIDGFDFSITFRKIYSEIGLKRICYNFIKKCSENFV